MPRNVRANIELGTNIVVAVAVVVVSIVVVQRYFFQQPPNSVSLEQREQMIRGTQINVPDVNWAQNNKSLVFFLKKDCVYCKSSAPFYRQLIEEASKRNVKVLAILPDAIEVAKEYVQSLALPIEDVRSGPLQTFKIDATPTVLFVDNLGTVKSAWIGAAPAREKEMREKLVALF